MHMSTSAATDATTPAAASASSLATVPIAVWALVGTLAVAAAGLGGALVMRPVDSKAPATPAVAQASTMPKFAPDDGDRPALAPSSPTPATQFAPAVKSTSQPADSSRGAGAARQAQGNAPASRAATCLTCGTVESVQAMQEKGQGSGLGVAGGAVAGGLIGNQIGGGNGKTAMTVIGAVGGAFAGNEVEKRVRATTVYDVQVRMEDGSLRSFRRTEPLAPGARVVVEGNALRVSNAGTSSPPGTLRTSGAAGNS